MGQIMRTVGTGRAAMRDAVGKAAAAAHTWRNSWAGKINVNSEQKRQ